MPALQRPLGVPRGEASIGAKLAALVSLVLLGIAGHAGYYERMYRERCSALDADLGALRRLRWERPVLRGPTGSGNAAEEAYAVLTKLPELSDALREELARGAHYGNALSEPALQELSTHAEALASLRAASQHGYARTELVPERGEHMLVPAYPRVIDAGLRLLAQAALSAPDECLRTAADVVRLGQDLVAGATPEAASISMRLSSLATPVIARCAAKAELTALRRAAHELHMLATRPPPTGATLELHDIVTAMKLRERASLTNKASAGEVIETLRARPRLLQALRSYADPTRLRQLTPARYPDALEEWTREQDARSRSPLPLVAQDAVGVTELIYDDMRGQALLRALAIGLATLVDRTYRGKLPSEPVSLHDPALADPFRGKPLNFRVLPDDSELVLWSVGEDAKDNYASDAWADAAPLDVTVRLRLPHLDTPREARGRKLAAAR